MQCKHDDCLVIDHGHMIHVGDNNDELGDRLINTQYVVNKFATICCHRKEKNTKKKFRNRIPRCHYETKLMKSTLSDGNEKETIPIFFSTFLLIYVVCL